MVRETCAILGAGAMGTALATPLVHNGQEVRLWGTELDTALLQELRMGRPHPRLDVAVSERVALYDPPDLAAALAGADIVVLAITSEGVVSILRRAIPYLQPGQPLLMVTKGLGYDALGRVSLLPPLLAAELPSSLRESCPIVAAGGPCKANEVAAGWPTATVYGSADRQALLRCLDCFQTAVYRVLPTDDITGLEVAAALKNSYAIALGICDGLEEVSAHPWHNLKAALFAQAQAEMIQLACMLGGRDETVTGLAGCGDLEVTALSGRNRLFGMCLGRGEAVAEALEAMRRREQTVEGVAATRFAVELVRQLAGEGRTTLEAFPLLSAIHALLEGATNPLALLSRAALFQALT
ncbi:MAG: NAD(P)-binding domain-containing protein [Ktedonobacteraceae bacterium]|nr:NAD(P)-binding domain-containing protein [Ktedonobacteraceae bacterium]